MKLLSLLSLCGLASLALAADSGKGKPGYCKDDKDCADTYSCISVQTTREGITDVKQCLPTKAGEPICTGVQPGLCPSFSTTWGKTFREISSVCAYIYPEGKGIKCLADPTNSTKGGVECLFINDPDNTTSPQVGVIYGCVDFDGDKLLFDSKSKSSKLASQFNYSEIIADNCVNPKNPSGSNFVCSSQGTCAPNSAGSMDYSCKCNIGFSGKYCEKIVDNKCYNNGVCGGGTCDLTKNECTSCPAGTLGNKCAQCDPTYDSTKVCGGNGKCVASSGDSTLGVSDSSSSGSSAKASSSTDGSTDAATAGSADGTTAPTAGDSSATGSVSDDVGAGTVAPSNSSRFLLDTRFLATKTYQCQCNEGYSDVHCGIKVKVKKNSTATTPAPTAKDSSMSAAALSASLSAIVLSVAAAWSS